MKAERLKEIRADLEPPELRAPSDNVIEELLNHIDELEERDLFLNALEWAGVDNWDGYCEARRMLDEWKKEESVNEHKL